jgi:mRNA-degrading endonuclease RelE of RelBE toxin-antitoxin system
MKLVIIPEAEEDLRSLDRSHLDYIMEKLSELEEQPATHQNSKIIQVDGEQVFSYRMKKDGRQGEKDYRAIYDIMDNEIKVAAIFHRDKGYRKDEISDRL